MRRLPRFGLPLALAALAATGCGDSATGPADDLTVTAGVAPTTFRAGDSVTITVTVTNAGPRTRSIVAQPCDDPFTVTAADGTVLPAVPRICALALVPPREVAPGGSVTITRDWRGDVGSTAGGSLGASIAPGRYTLRGFVHVSDRTAVVTSAPVSIEVLAR